MVGVMVVMATSFQKTFAYTVVFSAPDPAACHCVNPRLHQRLLDTQRQVWVSLLWGHCCFVLCPGVHKVLFVPSKTLSPESCVSSGGSMVGLMVTSFKRAYAIASYAATKAPAPAAVHC